MVTPSCEQPTEYDVNLDKTNVGHLSVSFDPEITLYHRNDDATNGFSSLEAVVDLNPTVATEETVVADPLLTISMEVETLAWNSSAGQSITVVANSSYPIGERTFSWLDEVSLNYAASDTTGDNVVVWTKAQAFIYYDGQEIENYVFASPNTTLTVP